METNEIINQFLGTISHELRIPLSIVKAAIHNLAEGVVGPVSKQQQEILKVASRNIGRLERLINDLLDLSRLEAGKIHWQAETVETASWLKETAAGFSISARHKGVQLKVRVPTHLPPLFADRDRLTQVLHNLLDNALRFAKSKVVVSAGLTKASGLLVVTVQDDGGGIAKEDQAKLFNKFQQLHRPRGGAGYQGTGLGLSIAKEIVDHMEGKIGVESERGKGAAFSFTVPIQDEKKQFQSQLQEALVRAQENRTPLAVLSLAIKNRQGVETVRQKFRRGLLRETDQFFYLPDKGQVIVLAENDRRGAEALRRRIAQATATKAIGLSLYPDDSLDPEILLEKATPRLNP